MQDFMFAALLFTAYFGFVCCLLHNPKASATTSNPVPVVAAANLTVRWNVQRVASETESATTLDEELEEDDASNRQAMGAGMRVSADPAHQRALQEKQHRSPDQQPRHRLGEVALREPDQQERTYDSSDHTGRPEDEEVAAAFPQLLAVTQTRC